MPINSFKDDEHSVETGKLQTLRRLMTISSIKEILVVLLLWLSRRGILAEPINYGSRH